MGISVTPSSLGQPLKFNTSVAEKVKTLNRVDEKVEKVITTGVADSSSTVTPRPESLVPAKTVDFPTPDGGVGVAVSGKIRGNETSLTVAVSYSSGQLKTSVTVNNKGVGTLNIGIGDTNARINTNGQASLTVKNGDVKLNASTGRQGTSLEVKVNVFGDIKSLEPFDQEKANENLNSSEIEYKKSRPHI